MRRSLPVIFGRVLPVAAAVTGAAKRQVIVTGAAGQTQVSRYRFAAFDGAPDRDERERLWYDCADPAPVTQRVW